MEVLGAGEDTWELQPDKVIRHHRAPRQQLFSPSISAGLPCHFHELLPQRVTHRNFVEGGADIIQDEWTDLPTPLDRSSPFWTGSTEIARRSPQPADDDEAGDDDDLLGQGDDGLRTPAGDGLVTPATPGDGLRTPGGGDERVLKRKRARTRQLQRGFGCQLNQKTLSL